MQKIIAAALLLASGAALAQEGTIDHGFAPPNGYWIQSYYASASEDVTVETLLVQPDDHIVFCNGVRYTNAPGTVRCARLGTDGFPDMATPFQQVVLNGVVIAPRAAGLGRLSNGKLMLLANGMGEAPNEFELWRIDTDGSIDTTFGTMGRKRVAYDLYDGTLAPADLLVQPDDRIVLTATLGPPPFPISTAERAFVAMRLMPDGSVDSSYGTRGQVAVTRFADIAQATPHDQLSHAHLTPDGGLIMAGGVAGELFFISGPGGGFTLTYKTGVAKLTASGALDASFGDGGAVIIDSAEAPPYAGAHDIVRTPDGGYVVAASNNPYSSFVASVLLRLKPNGALDFDFGNLGVDRLLVNDPTGSGIAFPPQIRAFAVQPDGKVIAAGGVNIFSVNYTIAIRLLPDGTPDPSFGTPGFGPGIFGSRLNLGGTGAETADRVALQGGRPLLAGHIEHDNPFGWAILYRLGADSMFSSGFE